jgi:long-chain acyl-CoA synthetase
MLFIAPSIGKTPTNAALDFLAASNLKRELAELQEVILLRRAISYSFKTYDELIELGIGIKDSDLLVRIRSVDPEHVCNLQFTSGTTGNPKAASLTSK